jgi:hypothetical protein
MPLVTIIGSPLTDSTIIYIAQLQTVYSILYPPKCKCCIDNKKTVTKFFYFPFVQWDVFVVQPTYITFTQCKTHWCRDKNCFYKKK